MQVPIRARFLRQIVEDAVSWHRPVPVQECQSLSKQFRTSAFFRGRGRGMVIQQHLPRRKVKTRTLWQSLCHPQLLEQLLLTELLRRCLESREITRSGCEMQGRYLDSTQSKPMVWLVLGHPGGTTRKKSPSNSEQSWTSTVDASASARLGRSSATFTGSNRSVKCAWLSFSSIRLDGGAKAPPRCTKRIQRKFTRRTPGY